MHAKNLEWQTDTYSSERPQRAMETQQSRHKKWFNAVDRSLGTWGK